MENGTTRDQIIKNADGLFYKQGFEKTSFANIAEEVHISRGNFYYHFKSKDEILDAVIEFRLDKTKKMLKDWESKGKTPSDRIQSFVHILIMNMTKIKLHGCPVGTLTTELSKLNHSSKAEANKVFNLFRLWLKKQFIELGHKKDADKYAMHLLSRSQGVATLANAFHDEKFVNDEVKLMISWVKEKSKSKR